MLFPATAISETAVATQGGNHGFSGYALEGWFREKFIEERRYTGLGPWWDRKGENEIDLVGEDALSKRIDFYEIKRDGARINLESLRRKADAFFAKNPEAKSLRQSFKALSLDDLWPCP